MLRRHHDVALRNRHLVGRLVSQRDRRPIQLQIATTKRRTFSTAEDLSAGPSSDPTPPAKESQAEWSTVQSLPSRQPQAGWTKRLSESIPVPGKAGVKNGKKDRVYFRRLERLSNWVDKKQDKPAFSAGADFGVERVETDQKGSFSNWSKQQVNKAKSGGYKDDIKKYKTKGETIPRRLSFDKKLHQFLLAAEVGSEEAQAKTVFLKEMVDLYKDKRHHVPRWQPDNIEGLDKGEELIERIENASLPIDQSLRQKLLARYKGLPLDEPGEEIDVSNLTETFTHLKPDEPTEPALKVVSQIPISSLYHKFPPGVVKAFQRAEATDLGAKIELTEEILNSLEPNEWTVFTKYVAQALIGQNAELITRVLENERFRITREVAEPLILRFAKTGKTAHVRRIMDLCAKAGANISPSHLLRSFRYETRIHPEKLKELSDLVVEMTARGFDERTYGQLMQLYGDSGRIDLVVALFNNHEQILGVRPLQSKIVHNSLLHVFQNSSMAEEAEYVYQAMKHGHGGAPAPDQDTYAYVSEVYRRRPDYYRKLLILAQDYVKTGLPFCPGLFGSLMKGCAAAGRLDATISIFDAVVSRADIRPGKFLITDYITALMQANVTPSDEAAVAVGLPMFEKLPIDPRDAVEDTSLLMVSEGAGPGAIAEEIQLGYEPDSAQESPYPEGERYHIPAAPVTPTTAGELLALVDLQYQHLRKYQPHLLSMVNHRLFLRLLVSHGFYNTFKKAYRWIALATGLRGKKSVFPKFQKKSKVSFADFAKGAEVERDIDPEERYEFDYLHFPLSQVEIYPALRSAYETRDLEFAKAAIADYDYLIENHSDKMVIRQNVRENWSLMAEAMAINTLARCGDLDGALERFDHALDTIVWNIDRPRLFAKRIAAFTGILVRSGLDDVARVVFSKLQQAEIDVKTRRKGQTLKLEAHPSN
ncbi:hypothetical protein ABW20_dc0110281 [Dactylellina cionopaga]|nr:hypothetical protein ABW20_dc0110281 [Dactylellina cionopaga]